MAWAMFLARLNLVSTMAKPACMNMTRKPASRARTVLTATRLGAAMSFGKGRSARLGLAELAATSAQTGAPYRPANARPTVGVSAKNRILRDMTSPSVALFAKGVPDRRATAHRGRG